VFGAGAILAVLALKVPPLNHIPAHVAAWPELGILAAAGILRTRFLKNPSPPLAFLVVVLGTTVFWLTVIDFALLGALRILVLPALICLYALCDRPLDILIAVPDSLFTLGGRWVPKAIRISSEEWQE
jgi:hypothetical protein